MMRHRSRADSSTRPRHQRGTSLLAAAVLIVSSLVGCSGRDETDRIRERVRVGVTRAEQHDVTGLMEMTVESFRAEPGHRDQAATAEALAGAFLYYGRFRVLHPRPLVALSDDGRSALVTMPFLVVRWNQPLPDLDDLRDDPAGWLSRVGEQADLYHLKVHLNKTGKAWQAVSAQLQPFRGLSSTGR